MATTRIEGDVYVNGNLQGKTLSVPDGTIDNAAVSASAALVATKLKQRRNIMYSQESATELAADAKYPIYSVYGATCTVIAVECGNVVAAADADVADIDVLKNGVTILDAVIRIDSATAVRTPVAGTVTTAAGVDGDLYEVHLDFTGGAGAAMKGVYVNMVVDEDPA